MAAGVRQRVYMRTMSGARRYLVVSDLHLADVEEHADGWMAHKSARYLFDGSFADLVRDFVSRSEAGAELTLVLNGDIVDFDLVTAVPEEPPWPVRRAERRRGLDATPSKSRWKLERVLSHHPGFVQALADFLCAGHRVVYLLGNHDRELHFPEVRRALVAALEACAARAGKALPPGRLAFEPWFFYVPGELYAEHGQQYDHYTSFRHLLHPVLPGPGEPVLALPMGNLTNRYLMSRMGYFNPHASDYILNVFTYVLHWLRFYAFSRHALFRTWLFGSLAVVLEMLKTRRQLRAVPPQHEEQLAFVARQNRLSLGEVRVLAGMQHVPITSRLFRMLRELWIDRLAIAVFMTLGTVALALSPAPLWAKLMVPLSTFPLIYFVYEMLAAGETIFTAEKEFPRRARLVAQLLPAQVVTFGHTHKPRQIPLEHGTTFVDTGTWAPVMDPKNRRDLLPGLRNYLELTFRDGAVTVDFRSWMFPRPRPPKGAEAAEPQADDRAGAGGGGGGGGGSGGG